MTISSNIRSGICSFTIASASRPLLATLRSYSSWRTFSRISAFNLTSSTIRMRCLRPKSNSSNITHENPRPNQLVDSHIPNSTVLRKTLAQTPVISLLYESGFNDLQVYGNARWKITRHLTMLAQRGHLHHGLPQIQIDINLIAQHRTSSHIRFLF